MTGEGYRGMLARLAQERHRDTHGHGAPGRKKLSNQDWVSKSDPEAKIAR